MPESLETPDKGLITLTGSIETLLLTLFARACDAESPRPILRDSESARIAAAIRDRQGYAFSRRVAAANGGIIVGLVATRARILDVAVEDFLFRHPGPATVLQLACGLDTRCRRVKWRGEGRVWMDVDRDEVVSLRRAVVEDDEADERGAPGKYRLAAADIIHDADWMSGLGVSVDRPILVVFEGLVMYLTGEETRGLLRHIRAHFNGTGTHGELRFDAVGPLAYFMTNHVFTEPLARMGTRFHSYIWNPRRWEREVPGLRFVGSSAHATCFVLQQNWGLLFGTLLTVLGWLLGRVLGGGILEFEF